MLKFTSVSENVRSSTSVSSSCVDTGGELGGVSTISALGFVDTFVETLLLLWIRSLLHGLQI